MCEEDLGSLKTDADVRAYFAFIYGGLFGVSITFVIPAIMAAIIEVFGLNVP